MSSEAYWERRQAERMWEYMEDAEEAAEKMARYYASMSRYLQGEAEDIFLKFQTKHGLSEAQARHLIKEAGCDLKRIREILQNETGDDLVKLLGLELPAYEARIRHFEELQRQLDEIAVSTYNQDVDLSRETYTKVASDAYYKTMFDLQQRTGLGFSFGVIDPKYVEKLLHSRWSGANYSARIWGNVRGMVDVLKEEMMAGFLVGKTNFEMAKVINYRFQVGSYKARRLVRTESCFVANEMEMEAYKEAGVETYRFVATLDLRTSEMCRKLDGKRFKVKEKKTGTNCPPMHPWCRSTTISDISDEDLAEMTRRARNPETGKNERVPANMTYEQWYEQYVKGKPQNKKQKKDVSRDEETKEKQINFRDVTEEWGNKAEQGKYRPQTMAEYAIDGNVYVVDGTNVIYEPNKREQEVAALLCEKLGLETYLVPAIKGKYKNISTPDYLINGERWDLKELTVGESRNLLRDIAHKKKKQAENFIFDISKSKLDYDEILRQAEAVIGEYRNTGHVKRVMLIKDSEILKILERK